jgi:hypothetical protein
MRRPPTRGSTRRPTLSRPADPVTAVEDLAARHYRIQARLALGTGRAVAREWHKLDRRNLSGSWAAGPGRRVAAIVTAVQRAAAEGATDYVSRTVEAQGGKPDNQHLTVDAGAFAGIASDGRPLDSLLYTPVVRAKQLIGDGASVDDALDSALNELVMIASSEVADAGRGAVGSAITTDRTATGYVRVLSPPSCARCVLLAGKEYAYNTGFQRHPRCDCVHLPTILGVQPHLLHPRDYFDSLDAAAQNRIFTNAGAQAIRDGADVGQVVNARRGMYALGQGYGRSLQATTEGMTRRGYARARMRSLPTGPGGRVRLMPEAIYQIASDREEAIRLLYRYGYLY